MRASVAILFVALSLLATLVAAGGREHQFTPPQQLAPKTLPSQPTALLEAAPHPQFETLPSQPMQARRLPVLKHIRYIDQELLQPKVIEQPVVQQQLLVQPITRTRTNTQPVIRNIMEETVVRPRVRTVVTVKPKVTLQKVTQPKVTERTIIKEEYVEERKPLPIKFENPTFEGGKNGPQLYGADWQQHINALLRQRYGNVVGIQTDGSQQQQKKAEGERGEKSGRKEKEVKRTSGGAKPKERKGEESVKAAE